MNDQETLVGYLHRIFSKYNIPNELRDWHFFAALEDFRFTAFSDVVEKEIIGFSNHPRVSAIAIFSRRAVELVGRAITNGHQPPEPFLTVLDELTLAINNHPTTLPADKLEIIEHNITDRRQWITPACWLPAGHVLAILSPEALKLELFEAINQCKKAI
jgi:hypothetical protein